MSALCQQVALTVDGDHEMSINQATQNIIIKSLSFPLSHFIHSLQRKYNAITFDGNCKLISALQRKKVKLNMRTHKNRKLREGIRHNLFSLSIVICYNAILQNVCCKK